MIINHLQMLDTHWQLCATTLLGLWVGRFLTRLIYRTPLIMQHEWQQDVAEFLAHSTDSHAQNHTQPAFAPLTLARHNHCTHCHAKLRFIQTLPIISFLCQRGRCRQCHAPIGLIYPTTELATALLSVLVIWHFGVSVQGVAGLVFVWFLVLLSGIDWRVQLLPDRYVAPLGMMGLLLNAEGVFTTPALAIFGAVAGFVSLWAIAFMYRVLRHQDGMGLGDAKLLAALGAWLGVQSLPLIVLIAAMGGVAAGLMQRRMKSAFAFGPYLAAGGVAVLLWGDVVWRWYLGV
ncbi:hypothetical protein B0181_01845 [Moraxella caviae]|nr:hypothetical protein B0181_01845 [Moraxella caviae]